MGVIKSLGLPGQYPNMVGLGSSAEVLQAVLERQRQWHATTRLFDLTGNLPPLGAGPAESLEMFLATGQHAAHNEILASPLSFR